MLDFTSYCLPYNGTNATPPYTAKPFCYANSVGQPFPEPGYCDPLLSHGMHSPKPEGR